MPFEEDVIRIAEAEGWRASWNDGFLEIYCSIRNLVSYWREIGRISSKNELVEELEDALDEYDADEQATLWEGEGAGIHSSLRELLDFAEEVEPRIESLLKRVKEEL